MNTKRIVVLLLTGTLALAGCSKTEKDVSFETDLYGTYLDSFIGEDEEGNVLWSRNDSYMLNDDNSYVFNYDETLLGENTTNIKDGSIINIEDINDEITKITFDNERTIYKYKNMLGIFYESDIPSKKTFNLFLKDEYSSVNEGHSFSEDKTYHYCTNHDSCTDDKTTFVKYKVDGKHVYIQNESGNWDILLYIVKDGFFAKEYSKSE